MKVNDPRVFLEHQRAILAERPDLEQHLANFDLAKDDKVLLLGLWIDGAPFNSDRSQTLETITLRLFGEKGLRVPLCAFPKAMRAKGKTYECIFEALAWSFQAGLPRGISAGFATPPRLLERFQQRNI